MSPPPRWRRRHSEVFRATFLQHFEDNGDAEKLVDAGFRRLLDPVEIQHPWPSPRVSCEIGVAYSGAHASTD